MRGKEKDGGFNGGRKRKGYLMGKKQKEVNFFLK